LNSNTHRYALVLAGGSGTRLWPLSRASRPKQLLALNGEETLLQQTVRRIEPLVAHERIFTVTHRDHRYEVIGQLHALAPVLADNVLAEPEARNTLPAIAWGAARIAARDPQAVITVFSSDHAVADTAAFQRAWLDAEVAAGEGNIVLFGMRPTMPATGFGYIQAGDAIADGRARRVSRFVEKPDAEAAARYLAAGNYYWNGGMFVFRADAWSRELSRLQPALFAALPALAQAKVAAPADLYATLPATSIDYGVLEKASHVAMVPADIGWSDLGSWEAIYRNREADASGNVAHGEVTALDSRDNLLWSEHGRIAAFGVANLAVVQTRDATLVCPRERTAELKPLVEAIRRADVKLAEEHLTVHRPWGSYTVLEDGPHYKIKRILVEPGGRLSLQMHARRSEHWVVIEGEARVTNGDVVTELKANESTYIQQGHRHRVENPGKVRLQIIEIQSGDYLGEDDIVRFDDDYGRE
jgi:mannose-1-phosphate guanylyltransferase/mannose-6-phosphate isomerase